VTSHADWQQITSFKKQRQKALGHQPRRHKEVSENCPQSRYNKPHIELETELDWDGNDEE